MKNFNLFINHNLTMLAGFVFLLGGSLGTWGKLIDYNIYKNGFPIIAKVIEDPGDCNKISSRGGYCTLEYKNKKYVIKAGKKFCHLLSGKRTVQMLTDDKGEDMLFPDEFTYFEFSTGFIFIVIGIIIMIKYFIPLSKIKNPDGSEITK